MVCSLSHPKIVSEAEWLAARKKHLAHEKRLTAEKDKVNAERRKLPMVKIDKEYVFDARKENAASTISSRTAGNSSSIISCSIRNGKRAARAAQVMSMLHDRDTSFVLISRAPLAKLEAYKALKEWNVPWHSSFGSDFNYEFHVTLDEKVAPPEYNYRSKAELEVREAEAYFRKGEQHGLSVFFRLDRQVFHTYSTYARGTESLTDAYSLLDTTPYGRQEDFEDSPPGWPQRPTYG
jgi:predicted dithiol-disulfide oxidoreductase (DUF899 family)